MPTQPETNQSRANNWMVYSRQIRTTYFTHPETINTTRNSDYFNNLYNAMINLSGNRNNYTGRSKTALELGRISEEIGDKILSENTLSSDEKINLQTELNFFKAIISGATHQNDNKYITPHPKKK
jgi:hypothetical protein